MISRAAGRSIFQTLIAPCCHVGFGQCHCCAWQSHRCQHQKTVCGAARNIFRWQRANFSIGSEGLWLRQGDDLGQTVIRAARSNLDGTVLFDVTLISYGETGGPNRRIEAIQHDWKRGVGFAKCDCLADKFGENPQNLAQNVRQFDVPSNLTLEQIRDRIGNPSSISIWDLPTYISQLESAGFSARRHSVWLHMEIARPLFLVGMLLIGASFTMRHVRFGGTGQALIVSVIFGFGLYYVRNFAQILGETGQIPILFAAYAPPLATILLAMGIILHMEDG